MWCFVPINYFSLLVIDLAYLVENGKCVTLKLYLLLGFHPIISNIVLILNKYDLKDVSEYISDSKYISDREGSFTLSEGDSSIRDC